MPNQSTIPSVVVYCDVPGFVGYRVGDDGSVWTCKNARWGLQDTWRQLRSSLIQGYNMVALRDTANKKTVSFRAGVLVLLAFVGPRPLGADSCHYNGDRQDDRLANLRWDTRIANVADTRRHGRLLTGEKSPVALLTDEKVREIRRLYVPGKFGYKRLGKMFGVAWQTITSIVKRKSWTHV